MKNKLTRWSLYTWCAIVILIAGCSENEPTPHERVLVSSTKFLTRSASELQTFVTAAGLDLGVDLKYDVDLYEVTYKTRYNGEEIIASGVVVLPKTSEQVGMLSFQHGTISAQNEAPTNLPLNSTSLILYAAIGSAGFIGVVPDFIGFGESSEIFHPYYVEKSTADAVIDNLKAAKNLASDKAVKFNTKLFLAGYSQGGYATMAAHKSIEENGLEEFNLVASFPASGGYDVKGMQEYFFGQENYDQPYYLAYVALSYQSYYGWPNIIDQFFQQPYADRIKTLFNGTNSAGTINNQLTESIDDYVVADLLNNIDIKADYKFIVDAFRGNSLVDWKPTKPMFMYHGDADTTVPFQNSVATYNALLANGTSTSVVTLTTLPGADHGSGVLPFIEKFISQINSLK